MPIHARYYTTFSNQNPGFARDSPGILLLHEEEGSDYVKSPNSDLREESRANPGRIPAYRFEILCTKATFLTMLSKTHTMMVPSSMLVE